MLGPNAGATSRHDSPTSKKTPGSVMNRTFETIFTRESSVVRASGGRRSHAGRESGVRAEATQSRQVGSGALYVNDYIFWEFEGRSANYSVVSPRVRFPAHPPARAERIV